MLDFGDQMVSVAPTWQMAVHNAVHFLHFVNYVMHHKDAMLTSPKR
jgi:hypothetical protein